MRRFFWLALSASAACEPAAAPGSICPVAIWGQPHRAGERLAVVGSFDDWAGEVPMRDAVDDWQVLELALPAGELEYLVVEAGRGRLDAYHGLSSFRASDAQEVSWRRVEDCTVGNMVVDEVLPTMDGGYELVASFVRARGGAEVDVATVAARDDVGDLELVSADGSTLRWRASERPAGRHVVDLEARDEDGVTARTGRGAAYVGAGADPWREGLVYQVMIDRFRGDAGAVLATPIDPGARAGGTLDGVRSEIESGYFEGLGVTALWISPVYTNPDTARPGADGAHLFESYHGYWPLDSRGVDPRIGGAAALEDLVASAHAHGLRVLLDLVPNHYDIDNPRVAEHRAEGWFHEHDPPCVCGTPSCPWGDFMETCWFAEYLPDLRFEQPEVLAIAAQDAVWWRDRFGVDGFRIDAVPMMPRAATRRILYELRSSLGPRAATFALGEIFTGAGAPGVATIRYHMGPDGLDSAFDFPTMWALRAALAHDEAGFGDVEAAIDLGEREIEGSGGVWARMIGNHDVMRFVSEAAGQADRDPWTEAPPQPAAAAAYERQALALGLVLTLPGLPVIYYGDETGLAGASDPDNRRVMPDVAVLPDARVALYDTVADLGRLRRCSPALRSGTRSTLGIDDDAWTFVRDASDDRPAIVLLWRGNTATTLSVGSAGAGISAWVDARSGTPVDPESVAMPPRSLRVLVAADDPCVQRP